MQQRKTVRIKVTPTHTNGYDAPYLMVEMAAIYTQGIRDHTKEKEYAINEAMERSRLGDFPDSWKFTAEYLN